MARADVHEAARRRAAELEGADRLRDAVFWLKVAEAASPSPSNEKADLDRLARRIQGRVDAGLKEAEARRLAGDIGRASAGYEAVLRLDPANAIARRALRQLDRTQKLRAIEQGGGGGPRVASEE
jgi:hypothetical protein